MPMIYRSFLFLVAVTAASSLFAENWPGWRGPRGDGVSQEAGVPTAWSESEGVRWKTPLPGEGASSPIVWEDAVFVTSQEDDKLLLLRIDRNSGKVVWQKQVGTAETPRESAQRSTQKFHKLHNNASPTPATDGEIVIAHYGNGLLAAFDFEGKELWRRDLQAEHGAFTIWWGHSNSPVLFEDLVISVSMQDSLAGVADAKTESYLIAHDKRTGEERWKRVRMTDAAAEECDSYTTPILFDNGDPQLVVMGGNELDAYAPRTGQPLWRLTGLQGGRTITGPVTDGRFIFATRGMRGAMISIAPQGTGMIDSSQIRWQFTENTPDSSTPVVANGLVFSVSDAGIAICLDAKTGELKWKERIGGDYKASPVAADGKVYFLNRDGLTTVVAASGEFKELAKNQLDDTTEASPAISGGELFIRGHGALYCVEKPK